MKNYIRVKVWELFIYTLGQLIMIIGSLFLSERMIENYGYFYIIFLLGFIILFAKSTNKIQKIPNITKSFIQEFSILKFIKEDAKSLN